MRPMSDLPPSPPEELPSTPPEHLPASPPEHLPDSSERSGGVDVSGRDIVNSEIAGRDIAERDIVGRDVVTTNVSGFGAREVTRIVIIVAAIVFVTAACFFSGGIVLGAAVFVAFSRPVNTTPQLAQNMQDEMNQVANTPPGQEFALNVSEEEINSYFHYIAGPQYDVTDGQVRLLTETNQVALKGKWSQLNVPFIAVFNTTPGDQPLQLQSAAVQILPLGDSTFGWVPVPTQILQPLAGQINDSLFKVATFKTIAPAPAPPGPKGPSSNMWRVIGIKK